MSKSLTEREKLVGFETAKWCLNYTTPAFIADPPGQNGGGIIANGSCSFIDTGKQRFGITNWHVVEAFRKKQSAKNDLNFQLGSLVVDVNQRIIDEDQQLDLATIQVSEFELSVLKKQFCSCRSWPPKKATNDEVVVFAGYPGIFRKQKNLHEVMFESVDMLEVVTSSSSNQFGIVFDRQAWITQVGVRELHELTDLGGFSGAAVFRCNESNTIAYLEPVGVIFEHNQAFDIQLARHIDFVDDTGHIV